MKLEYTEQAKEVLDIAEETARAMKHSYVGTEHLLFAMIESNNGTAWKVLTKNGVDINTVRSYLKASQQVSRSKLNGDDAYSVRLKRVLENAQKEAVKLKSDKIGTEHLLIAMLKMEDIVATRLLTSMSINTQKVYIDQVQA